MIFIPPLSLVMGYTSPQVLLRLGLLGDEVFPHQAAIVFRGSGRSKSMTVVKGIAGGVWVTAIIQTLLPPKPDLSGVARHSQVEGSPVVCACIVSFLCWHSLGHSLAQPTYVIANNPDLLGPS